MGWQETTIIHPDAWSASVEDDLLVGLVDRLGFAPTGFDAACRAAAEALASAEGPQVVTLTENGASVRPADVSTSHEHREREAALEQQRVETKAWSDAVERQYAQDLRTLAGRE